MSISVLTLHMLIPDCNSLKEKRSRIQPILARLHREFNLSTAEIGRQDMHAEALLACVVISTDANHNQRLLQSAVEFTSTPLARPGNH